MNKEKNFYYVLIFLCLLWIIISLLFFKKFIFLYYLNLFINPIGIFFLSLIIFKNKYHKKLKFIISLYFFIYGFLFLIYDIYNYFLFPLGIDSFYFFSDLTMAITPFKVYKNEIKKYFKTDKQI